MPISRAVPSRVEQPVGLGVAGDVERAGHGGQRYRPSAIGLLHSRRARCARSGSSPRSPRRSCRRASRPATPAPPPPPPPPRSSSVVVDGQGNGHGRGLSAWGAYGSAVNRGWTLAADPRPLLRRHGARRGAGERVDRRAADGARRLAGRSASSRPAARRSWNGGGVRRAPGRGRSAPNRYDVYGVGRRRRAPAARAGWALRRAASPGPITFTHAARPDDAPRPATCSGVCQPNGSVDPLPRARSRPSTTAPAPTARSTTCSSRTTCAACCHGRCRRAGATPAAAPGMHALYAHGRRGPVVRPVAEPLRLRRGRATRRRARCTAGPPTGPARRRRRATRRCGCARPAT